MARIKIDSPIVAYKVVPKGEELEPVVDDVVLYDRPEKITGRTYKIRPASSDTAMYITINNITLDDGSSRPFEIFINTKSVDGHDWITALTRMLSSVFRMPGDLDFVTEELSQVYDPKDSYWSGKEFMPSVVAHIGKIIGQHFEWTKEYNDSRA
ncbi:MAG: hypothetical protein QQN63_01875 [Nitrosopumilus sp.]